MTEPEYKPVEPGPTTPGKPARAGGDEVRRAAEDKPGRAAEHKPRRAGPVQVAQAVFWSFLGIRKRAAHEKDAVTITLVQVIVAGLIGAALLVLGLVFLVSRITG